jgi:hypothetical protein
MLTLTVVKFNLFAITSGLKDVSPTKVGSRKFIYTIKKRYFSYLRENYIVTCIPIASQRFRKHIPAKDTHAIEGHPLLGNGPANTHR